MPGRDVSFAEVTAVIFDKDGTLLDFELTWNRATAEVLALISNGDAGRLAGAAAAVAFDLDAATIRPGSPLVSESNEVIAALLAPWVDPVLGLDRAGLDAFSSAAAIRHLTPMTGADDVVRTLHARGIRLAIATNDSAAAAQATIEALGWTTYFDAAIGYDSGYGAKPAPGMVEGAIRELGATAERSVMVGDSSHDVVAGNSAGARTVQLGVLSVDGSTAAAAGSVDQPDVTIGALGELIDLF